MIHALSLIAPAGNTLAISAAGRGTPLVLLHGFPLDHRMWLPQIEQLSGEFHVIAPDFRGFGGSTLDDTAFSIGDLAEDIEFIRRHLTGDRPLWLCGLSMGGYVAFEYWRRYPQHLAGLILSNTKPTADPPAAREARLAMGERALASGTWPAVQEMIPKLLGSSIFEQQPAVVRQVEAMIREVAPRTIMAAQAAMAGRADFSDSLPQIRVPCLVLTGEEDQIAPPEATAQWAARMRSASFHVLPGAGHLLSLEAANQFTERLREFIVE